MQSVRQWKRPRAGFWLATDTDEILGRPSFDLSKYRLSWTLLSFQYLSLDLATGLRSATSMTGQSRKDLNYVLRKLARRCASITLISRLASFSTSRCDPSRDILAS